MHFFDFYEKLKLIFIVKLYLNTYLIKTDLIKIYIIKKSYEMGINLKIIYMAV